MPSVACLVPCYKRPEYTAKCLQTLKEAQEYKDTTFHLYDDGSCDGTSDLLLTSTLPKIVHINPTNKGLRSILISFITQASAGSDFITVVGNDCLMPKDWLTKILDIFSKTDVDILSPNVMPSNAAYKWGIEDRKGKGYRPAQTVGGLWTMRRSLVNDMFFEQIECRGIIGAFQVLRQIIVEKSPRVGWTTEVEVGDMGHWSGLHPDHIKTPEHKQYSAEIGRPVSW